MPANTSPVPAVARRWSPLVLIATRPSGPATTVVGPFNSAMQLPRRASRSAASRRSLPGGSPISAAYSPSCGVSTVVAWRLAQASSSRSPPPPSASASSTAGASLSASNSITPSSTPSSRPSPLPMTSAPTRCSAATVSAQLDPTPPSPFSCRVTASTGSGAAGRWPCGPGTPVPSVRMRESSPTERCDDGAGGALTSTYPAPARLAAWATRAAAPVMPGEPPITQTALCHLCALVDRPGQ